jgi:hypothetical protein
MSPIEHTEQCAYEDDGDGGYFDDGKLSPGQMPCAFSVAVDRLP